MFGFLSICFLCVYCRFLICGYHESYIYKPIAIPTCLKLIGKPGLAGTWVLSSSSMHCLLLPWWDVGLESEGLEQELDASQGFYQAAAATKSLQLCPTLWDLIDGSPPGSSVPGFLQARTLEWIAISSSNAWKWKVKVKSLSRGRLFTTPWTVAYQAPPSMGFSRQEYWSGVPLPSTRLSDGK